MRTALEDRRRNADLLLHFYQEVLASFSLKLEKEYRYRGPVSAEDLQLLEEMVKKRLNFRQYTEGDAQILFKKYLGMREGTHRKVLWEGSLQIKETNETKAEKEVPDTIKEVVKQEEEQNIHEKQEEDIHEKQKEEESNHQDSFDDLELFQNEVKKGNVRIMGIKYEDTLKKHGQSTQPQPEAATLVKSEPPESMVISYPTLPADSSSSEEEEEADFFTVSSKQMGTALISTFSPFQMRRKPKQQKIMVELQNVFVKFANCPLENYFPRVLCELTKIEKEEVSHVTRK